MLYFWKTKNFTTLYKAKIIFRNFKDFTVQTYKLFIIKTSFPLIYMFVVNNFKSFNQNSYFIKKIYESSIFQFSDWFTNKIPILIYFLDKCRFPAKINLLEIGSFEGRSSIFFLNYFKEKLSVNSVMLTCVDTWEGSNEKFHEKINFNSVEKNFDSNTKIFSHYINKKKLTSYDFFKTDNKKLYDLIFIDGSHEFKDVLADAQSSFSLLNKKGIIIFDDFNWFYYRDAKSNPAHAINIFLKDKINEVEIIFVGMILILRKI